MMVLPNDDERLMISL